MALTPYAAFALAGALAAAVLAFVVFITAPHRRPNRLLAVLLLFEGMAQGMVGLLALGVGTASSAPAAVASVTPTQMGLAAVFTTSVLLLPVLYLLFLATLDSPLVRPLRPRGVQVGLVVLGVAAAALRLVRPELFRGATTGGPAQPYVFTAFGAVALFGLLVAASAYRRTQASTVERRQAGAYLAAFGSRDGAFVLYFALFALSETTAVAGLGWIGWLPLVATFLFALFMAYGILRAQLFDIDLKIKWTVKQSTVAGAFLAVFFAVSESAAAFFEGRVGTYLGIGAAALLVFALAPLQELAGRVADRAVPGVRGVSEMDDEERRRVYAGMVRAAFRDGRLDAHERVMLADLRAELGLTSEETERIEVEVARGVGEVRHPGHGTEA